jgi:hypothetical protein
MSGADQADQEIVERMQENDIVITQDIPLAAQVIEKGGVAIHPRGEVYTTANVKARLHFVILWIPCVAQVYKQVGHRRYLNVINESFRVLWIKPF